MRIFPFVSTKMLVHMFALVMSFFLRQEAH